jgi:hypothetical protein
MERRAAATGTPFDAPAAYSPALVIVSDRDPLEEHSATPERIGELLLDSPAFLQSAKVFDMLLALPKVGRVKAAKIMNNCRVSPNKTFGGLSDRQRAELAERLNH